MKRMYIQTSISSRWRIRNRTIFQWMTLIVAYWSLLFPTVSGLPGVFSYLKYIPDGILIVMTFCVMGKKLTVKRDVLANLMLVTVFLAYCLLIYLFQYQSVAYFLWGFRNNFRFYLAFFAFVNYLDETDVDTWFRTVEILFWINAGLSVYQFLFMGISGDYLGGIFGIRGASNAYTLCFMSIVVGKSFLDTFNGTERFSKSVITCTISILIATMAELKVYYFIFICLMLGAAAITRFSVKKLIYMLLAMVAIMIGALLLVEWFGFDGFFSIRGLWESATKDNYASNDDLNRLSAIPTLNKRILTNPLQQLFGLGLGNCDTSAFAICNTPFYKRYGYLHYTWFTGAMVYLETGFLGLGMYIGFFVVCLLKIYGWFKSKTGDLLQNQLSILMSMLCLALIFYNPSLRIESGYMMYFVLAMPFIKMKKEKLITLAENDLERL